MTPPFRSRVPNANFWCSGTPTRSGSTWFTNERMGISVGSSPKRNRTETRAKAARLHTRSNMSGKHGVAGFSPRFSLRMQRSSVIILTGLSGSGKGTFLRALEDRGFFCVDNLPLGLLSKFYELILKSESESAKAAMVIDVREGQTLSEFPAVYKELKDTPGLEMSLWFLEASDAVLVRRFSEGRRPHPS